MASSICMLLLRWGSWPPWTPLLLRTLEKNPTANFILLGDAPPRTSRAAHPLPLPENVRWHEQSLQQLLQRVRSLLGVSPAGIGIAGTSSKVSDFKPLLGALYPELLSGCSFWGYMQEDQILGNLRLFFDEALLSKYDTFSPLPAPMFNAGPFMLYRNTPHVNTLFFRSADWSTVAKDKGYLVFDEWWGTLSDPMPKVIAREAAAGRLRAYTSVSTSDGRMWLHDDFVYKTAGSVTDDVRWYHDTLHATWRNGCLWEGEGSAAVQLWDGAQGQMLVLHLLGSKYETAFQNLEPTEHFRRAAAHAVEARITKHGLWLKTGAESRTHALFSGRFPGVHALVRSAELAATVRALSALGLPTYPDQFGAKAEAVLPCIVAAKFDKATISPKSCRECEAVALKANAALAMRYGVKARAAGAAATASGAKPSLDAALAASVASSPSAVTLESPSSSPSSSSPSSLSSSASSSSAAAQSSAWSSAQQSASSVHCALPEAPAYFDCVALTPGEDGALTPPALRQRVRSRAESGSSTQTHEAASSCVPRLTFSQTHAGECADRVGAELRALLPGSNGRSSNASVIFPTMLQEVANAKSCCCSSTREDFPCRASPCVIWAFALSLSPCPAGGGKPPAVLAHEDNTQTASPKKASRQPRKSGAQGSTPPAVKAMSFQQANKLNKLPNKLPTKLPTKQPNKQRNQELRAAKMHHARKVASTAVVPGITSARTDQSKEVARSQ